MDKQNGNTIIYEIGKIAVDGYYDYQSIRLAQMNRIRDVVRRKKEGIPFDKPEEEKLEKTHEKKYTDRQFIDMLKELQTKGDITEEENIYISKLCKLADETEKTEERYKTLMDQYLQHEPLWNQWLTHIKGISSVLSSNLIKNFNYCETYPHISSMWKHTGYDPDGAKGRKKGETIHYNPKLKTLIWKIGDSFIKQRTPTYRQIYDTEKDRQLLLIENEAENAPKSKLHADLRARRKMMKIFMQHYWLIGRTIKGVPVSNPYQHDHLGHTHFIEPPHYPEYLDKPWKTK